MTIIGALDKYSLPSCRGFVDIKTACSHAERLTKDKKEQPSIRYIILTGDVFFVSDTCDVHNYEKLLFVYRNGLQNEPDLKPGRRHINIGEKTYSDKYKLMEE